MVSSPSATGTHALFYEHYLDDHAPIVGGKNASLGALTAAGFPVPCGFAVPTHAFVTSLERNGVDSRIDVLLRDLDVRDLSALQQVGALARQEILDSGPAEPVEAAIRSGYQQLCERCATGDLPVAVRSSATAEDQPDASFAGQQDTYLWVRGADEVVNHVVRCWASLYTDRAIAYRHEQGYDSDTAKGADVAMGVAVQKMVRPVAAGVAFTLDPTNGDRSKVVIDAAWGLGESVVSGRVTPDNFVVDKVVFEIVRRTVSAKELELVVAGDAVHDRELDRERSVSPSLTDDQVKAVARMARQVEKHFGRPQDIEWAIDPDTADGVPAVTLLQSRPETVWSNRPRQSVTTVAVSALDGVVKTLLNPIRVRAAE